MSEHPFMLIHLKGCYTIIGKIISNSKKHKLKFSVPLKHKPPVIVEIIPTENRVESFHEFEVSKEMWEILQSNLYDGKNLPGNLQAELSETTSNISRATRKVLNLIKYCFNQTDLDENLFSVRGYYWSIDRSKWKPLPMRLHVVLDIQNLLSINEDNAKAIQKYLESDFEPFFALRHLHRAKNESNPRYKWIEATIAAELAIKEFLIRKKPEIETLLLEVPSPPLRKLYGSILESFTNQRSPKLNELTRGAEIRNKLIHRPKEIKIKDEEANKYVHDVEIAIGHLLTLLYPGDPIMERFFKPRARLVRAR